MQKYGIYNVTILDRISCRAVPSNIPFCHRISHFEHDILFVMWNVTYVWGMVLQSEYPIVDRISCWDLNIWFFNVGGTEMEEISHFVIEYPILSMIFYFEQDKLPVCGIWCFRVNIRFWTEYPAEQEIGYSKKF